MPHSIAAHLDLVTIGWLLKLGTVLIHKVIVNSKPATAVATLLNDHD